MKISKEHIIITVGTIVIIALVGVFAAICVEDAKFHPEEICLNAVLREFDEEYDVWATEIKKLRTESEGLTIVEYFKVTVYCADRICVYIGGIEYRMRKTLSVDMDFAYSIAAESELGEEV